jgi:LysR family transcriptional activator of nhaA
MEWLNYHHLLYFWTVARTGSVTAAAAELRLAQPTISGQLRALEDALGEKLFVRVGRNIALTEFGQTVFRYADEIFSVGRELLDVVRGRPTQRYTRLNIGVADVVPKLVAYRLLAPALTLQPPVAVICREGKSESLIADLSIHALDLVVSDAPVPPTVSVRAYSHLLGSCGVTFFASEKVASRLRGRFPALLDGAPMLLPTVNTSMRRDLEQWFGKVGVTPRVVSEFEDSALLKVFGEAGAGVFAGPSAIEGEISRQYNVKTLGRTDKFQERYYAISVERKLKHPAVIAISAAAREGFFR